MEVPSDSYLPRQAASLTALDRAKDSEERRHHHREHKSSHKHKHKKRHRHEDSRSPDGDREPSNEDSERRRKHRKKEHKHKKHHKHRHRDSRSRSADKVDPGFARRSPQPRNDDLSRPQRLDEPELPREHFQPQRKTGEDGKNPNILFEHDWEHATANRDFIFVPNQPARRRKHKNTWSDANEQEIARQCKWTIAS